MNSVFLIARGQAREYVGNESRTLADFNEAYKVHPDELISLCKESTSVLQNRKV